MKHTSIITKPPKNVPTNQQKSYVPDGAVCGNGDIGLVLGGNSEHISIYVSKSDFWKSVPKRNCSGISLIGNINITVNGADTSKYHVEQQMDEGKLLIVSETKNGNVEVSVIPCATDNVILTEISVPNGAPTPQISISAHKSDDTKNTQGEKEGISFVTKSYVGEKFLFESEAIITMKQVSFTENNDNTIYRYAFYVMTNHDSPAFLRLAHDRTYIIDAWKYDWLLSRHADFWKDFWGKSKMEISDKELEMNWYSGLYIMACCNRNPVFPAGIFGNFITKETPEWGGDYHLNYNYEAPFYPLFSSNHEELGKNYEQGLLDFTASGRRYAKDYLSCGGVYFPVGLGPLGSEPSINEFSKYEYGHSFLGQKSNALYSSTIITMHWYSTLDKAYALSTAYPYLRDVIAFWEDYLKFEDGRYVIYTDAIHEVEYYKPDFNPDTTPSFKDDFNNVLSLGAIRMVIDCLLSMINECGINEEKKEKWEHILSHLSKYPTFEKDGKTVFRYTEKGMEWRDTNSLGIQHIYPCGRIGMFSDKEEFEIAQNSFRAVDRWLDNNAFSSYYPCAARLLIDADTIIKNLKRSYELKQSENMLFDIFGGCLENTSASVTTLNEMMLQSYSGTVCIFPDWTDKIDAKYTNLVADGGFLVSSEIKSGKISYVKIHAKNTRPIKILNPYPNTSISINGNVTYSSDKLIELNLNKGDCVELLPA